MFDELVNRYQEKIGIFENSEALLKTSYKKSNINLKDIKS